MRKMLLTSIVAMSFSLAGIILFMALTAPSTASIEEKIYGGAFRILNQPFARNTKLREAHLTNKPDLVASGVDIDVITALEPGEVSVVYISDVESLIQRSISNPTEFYYFFLELSPSEEMELQFRDLVSLVELFLENNNQKDHDLILAEIRMLFDLPISITKQMDFDLSSLSSRDQQHLSNSHILGIDDGFYDGGSLLVKLPATGEFLTIGPVPLSLSESINNGPYYLVTFGLIGVFLSLMTSYLWLWPLWRRLKQLNSVAKAYGEGDFSASFSVSPISPLQEVSKTFNRMGSQIQGLLESQNNLTNALAHEIRTPLSRIRFRLDELTTSSDNDQVTAQANDILSDVLELEYLTTEMLRHAEFKSDKAKLTLTPTEIVLWVEQLLKKYNSTQKAVTIHFIDDLVPANTMVQLDKFHAERALGNLLKNAQAYASEHIVVQLKMNTDTFEISVEDDGIGVDPHLRERILEPFFRADTSRNKNTGGFGLGLAITNTVCQLHGGSCRVTSSHMGGAKFVITLPRNSSL